ncbi:uncharacterized protein LOC106478689 [Limulus polyphemus]|uniref:Uncharacterized protein LOC106478689 n=1 Tax=Limulus polyphemus TaxID=6850 RepID=A0ABM1S346_LIMPO|nr:uncharacterized protein LOC106478689 [Limulus polyphemus]
MVYCLPFSRISNLDSPVKKSKEENILGNSVYDNIQRLTSKNKTLKEKYMKLLSNILHNHSEAQFHFENIINKNSGSNVVCEDFQKLVEPLRTEVFHVEKILKRLNTEAARVLEGYQAYPFGEEKTVTVDPQKLGSAQRADVGLSSEYLKQQQPVTVEQIGASLNILKTEIEKVQAVLASLSRGETLQTKLLCQKATLERQGFSEDGTGKSLCWRSSDNAEYIANENRNDRISAVSTSKTSSRLDHLHPLTYSCPILPSETSLVTKSTQTEPLVTSLNENFGTALTYNVPVPNKMCQNEYLNQRISTCTFPEKELQHPHVPTIGILHNTDAQEGKFSPVSPFVYRNRSFSFISAIKEGNNDISCCEEATSTEKLECDTTSIKPSHEPQKFQSVPVKLDDVKWFRHPKENNESLPGEASTCSPSKLEKRSYETASKTVYSPQPQSMNVSRTVEEFSQKLPAPEETPLAENTCGYENGKRPLPPNGTLTLNTANKNSAIFSLFSSSTELCRAIVHCASSQNTTNIEEKCIQKTQPPPYRQPPLTSKVSTVPKSTLLPVFTNKSDTVSPIDSPPDGISVFNIQDNVPPMPVSQRSRRRSLERQSSIPSDLATAFPKLLMLAALSEQSEQVSSCEEYGDSHKSTPHQSMEEDPAESIEHRDKDHSTLTTNIINNRLTEVQREGTSKCVRTERQGDRKSEVGTGKVQETIRQDTKDSTRGKNSVFVQQMPRVEINMVPSEVLSTISDEEEFEDEQQNNKKENITLEPKKKDNIMTGKAIEKYSPGSCAQDQEKQERVVSSLISEKWKKRDSLSKNKNLIPELMETSETESAKGSASGSMESEAADLPGLDIVIPPTATSDSAFPSIPDSFLRRIGLHKDCPYSNEQLTEQEVESKFGSLSLAFKTDKLTLSKRLELHQRQRNTAEKNIENEIKALKESLNVISQLSTNHQVRELITSIKQQVDVLQQSTSRVSCRAEVYGAVQQEERVNRAFDVMVMYVENMKRIYEKEHHELEETRRLLMENHLVPVDSESAGEDSRVHKSRRYLTVSNVPKFDSHKKAPRLAPYSVHLQAVKEISRRASVAMFHRTSFFERYLSPLLPSGSFIMDSQSHPLGSVASASGNVGSASISNFNSKLTFSVVPSFPSTAKSKWCSFPIVPPLCLNKPPASLSLPFKLVDNISEETELKVKDKESCKNSSKTEQREGTGNKGKSECDNTQRMQEDSRGSLNVLQIPEVSDIERETVVPCLCYEEPEIIDNISRREIMEHWAVKNRTLDENTSCIGKIYNKLMNLDSATLRERSRFGLSVVLVIAGILSLLVTFLPCQAIASTYQMYPISVEEIVEILFAPYLTLESPKNII